MATIVPGVCRHLNPDVENRGNCDAGINAHEIVTKDYRYSIGTWKSRMPCVGCKSVRCPGFSTLTDAELKTVWQQQKEEFLNDKSIHNIRTGTCS